MLGDRPATSCRLEEPGVNVASVSISSLRCVVEMRLGLVAHRGMGWISAGYQSRILEVREVLALVGINHLLLPDVLRCLHVAIDVYAVIILHFIDIFVTVFSYLFLF